MCPIQYFTYIRKVFTVYLNFKFNRVPCIFPGSPNWDRYQSSDLGPLSFQRTTPVLYDNKNLAGFSVPFSGPGSGLESDFPITRTGNQNMHSASKGCWGTSAHLWKSTTSMEFYSSESSLFLQQYVAFKYMMYISIIDFPICSQWNGWATAIYSVLLSIQNGFIWIYILLPFSLKCILNLIIISDPQVT